MERVLLGKYYVVTFAYFVNWFDSTHDTLSLRHNRVFVSGADHSLTGTPRSKLTGILQITAFSRLAEQGICSNILRQQACLRAVWGWRDGSSVTSSHSEVFMEDRALSNSSTTTTNLQSSAKPHQSRGVWVLTAYGVSGLVLFGILLYYFSTYVTH